MAVEPIRRQAKRPVPLAIPFVLSLLISLLHVGVPFNRFATNQQSQTCNAGWAMTKGQVPFGDFYGTNWSALLCNQLVGKFSWWTLDLDDPSSDCPLLCGDLPLSGCALAGVR